MNKVRFGRSALAAAVAASSLSLSGCWLTDNDGAYIPDDDDMGLFAVAGNIPANGVCPEGGREIAAGLDTNFNSILDADEVTDRVQICSGTVVENMDGDLLRVTTLDTGSERCASGGYLVEAVRDGTVEKSFDVCNVVPDGNADTGEDTSTPEENTTEVETVATGSVAVSVPAEFDVPEEQPGGDFDGAMMFAGSSEAVAEPASVQAFAAPATSEPVRMAFASSASTMEATDTTASSLATREVASFVAERPVMSAGSDAGEVLQNFTSQINTNTDLNMRAANVSTGQLFGGIIYNGVYTLSVTNGAKPTEVANALVSLLGVNAVGGEVTGLPASLASETPETDFRLFMTVVYQDQGTAEADDDKLVLIASVTPAAKLNTWENAISRLNSGRNVSAPGVTRTAGEQQFTVEGGSNLADFLFVIDNSGSMSDNQSALADAADSFINVMQSSGLDFQIGTINTGATVELADENGDGPFTSDLDEFRADVVNQGTYGSATETGIWNAEQALQSVAEGDSTDGVVTAEGYPRAGSSLSVVILSDEESQYTRRSGGVEFDPQINLFTDRGYTVYSLIEEYDAPYSQYDDLALATGGSFGNIGAVEDFSTFMEEISKSAGGVSSRFELPENVDPVTIEVRKNGTVVPVSQDAENGWIYRPLSNTVLLRGTALPVGGDVITIRYEVIN